MAKPLLTLDWILRTLGAAPNSGVPETDQAPVNVTTDSRQAGPANVFLPVQGETMDGHKFIEGALKLGAPAVILRRDVYDGFPPDFLARFPKTRFVPVDDTLRAYRELAHAWRKLFAIPVVCVAGSAGKTTSKEMLAAILSGKFKSVLKTVGSQNGFLGIPMTLLDLRATHDVAVIEVGIDEIGAMAQHLEVVRPSHSILTAIGPEHLEKLNDLTTVAREELLSLEWTQQHGGTVALNLNDPLISAFPVRGDAVATYGIAPVQAAWAHGAIHEGELAIRAPGQKPFTLKLPLPGAHNAQNLLGAVTLALRLGLSPEEIARGLASFAGAPGRSETARLPNGTQVFCDFYNAQPASMRAAFLLLQPGALFCLGDMRELGAKEADFHRELAAPLKAARPGGVFLLGDKMKWLADELKGASFPVRRFGSHAEMADAIAALKPPPAEILIKGSRGMTMEKVFEALKRALPTA